MKTKTKTYNYKNLAVPNDLFKDIIKTMPLSGFPNWTEAARKYIQIGIKLQKSSPQKFYELSKVS